MGTDHWQKDTLRDKLPLKYITFNKHLWNKSLINFQLRLETSSYFALCDSLCFLYFLIPAFHSNCRMYSLNYSCYIFMFHKATQNILVRIYSGDLWKCTRHNFRQTSAELFTKLVMIMNTGGLEKKRFMSAFKTLTPNNSLIWLMTALILSVI